MLTHFHRVNFVEIDSTIQRPPRGLSALTLHLTNKSSSAPVIVDHGCRRSRPALLLTVPPAARENAYHLSSALESACARPSGQNPVKWLDLTLGFRTIWSPLPVHLSIPSVPPRRAFDPLELESDCTFSELA